MKIRIIQLINNFYRDGKNCPDEKRTEALGTYCTFGYFDALEVKTGQFIQNLKDSAMWREINDLTLGTLDGSFRRRNLICITNNDAKDTEFWEQKDDFPYLFVSLIRLKHTDQNHGGTCQIMQNINKEKTAMAYYSYNHSELVIVKLDKYYSNALNFILCQRQRLTILNMYSIFSVRESILKTEESIRDSIQDETIDVRLHIIIKDDQQLDSFLELLISKLYLGENSEIRKYYTLGNCDMLIEIKNINIQRLLSCYSMGSLLTHTSPDFELAIYNIETEILSKGELLPHGKLDDQKDSGIERTEL